MVKEGQAHAAEDKLRRERVEAHNDGDNSAYQAEKFIRENGDKIPAEKKSELEGKITAVRQAIAGEDVSVMRSATEDLKNTFSQIGAAMYQNPGEAGSAAADSATAGANGAGNNDAGGSSPDDVVEGEFRETK